MDKANGMKITITRDGPYEVSGGVPLGSAIIGANDQGESMEWEKGRSYSGLDEPYRLCRCGHSRTKPLCDGTHDDAEFCGKEQADRPPYEESAELLAGERVDLMDDESLCVGARFCDVGRTVWQYAQHSGSQENAEMAVREACKCPSGRLTVVDQDGRMLEPELAPEIDAVQDPVSNCRGPLWVKGGIEIEGCSGEKYEVRNRVTLCRCGESKNQPYCDASHYECSHMQGADE